MQELHIKEELINKIKFNSKKIDKLNIIYDFRDRVYSIDYLENSFTDLLEQYSGLTYPNISLYIIIEDETEDQIIKEISHLFFNIIKNIENYSFNIWDLYKSDYMSYCRENLRLSIKNLPNGKIILKGKDIPIEIYKDHFKEIEKIDLYGSGEVGDLRIEENSSVSSIKKVSINSGISLHLPIKSFSSLNFLELNISQNNFYLDFPLFSKNSLIKFNNLEYILLKTETIDAIIALTNKFSYIPNLRFLSIFSQYIYNTNYPYQKEIISKLGVLKNIHTLIIDCSEENNNNSCDVSKYYSIFSELKNTSVKFCFINLKL